MKVQTVHPNARVRRAVSIANASLVVYLRENPMLRLIIIALLIWGGYYVVSSLTSRYSAIEKKEAAANAPAPVPSSALEGMPYQLQPSLDAAEAPGPAAL